MTPLVSRKKSSVKLSWFPKFDEKLRKIRQIIVVYNICLISRKNIEKKKPLKLHFWFHEKMSENFLISRPIQNQKKIRQNFGFWEGFFACALSLFTCQEKEKKNPSKSNFGFHERFSEKSVKIKFGSKRLQFHDEKW